MNLISELGQETTYDFPNIPLLDHRTKRIAVGRSDEHSPEGGSKRLQRRRLAMEAVGNGSGAPQEEDADQTSLQLTRERVEV